LKSFFAKLLGNGLVTVTIAIGVGLLAMLGLLKGYEAIWGEGETSSVAVNEDVLPPGPEDQGAVVDSLPLRCIPAAILDVKTKKPLGYFFVDLAVAVSGPENYSAVEEKLGDLKFDYSKILETQGAGSPEEPGRVDYGRLSDMFLKMARDDYGLEGIQEVTVKAAKGCAS